MVAKTIKVARGGKPAETKEPKDIDLNRLLDDMISSGKQYLHNVHQMNRDAIRYVYGDQHAGKQRKKGWEYIVINRMYADMTQEVAMLSANNPRIAALPRGDTDIETAKLCGQVLKGEWGEGLKMRVKTIQGEYDSHLSGIKIAKVLWEPKDQWDEESAYKTGRGWKGKIDVNIVNPDYFGCDPECELAIEIPEKARFVWTERYVDKKWAAQRWPEYKKHLDETAEPDTDDIGAGSTGTGSTDESGFNRDTYAWAGKEGSTLDEQVLQARLADMVLGKSRNTDTTTQVQDPSMVKVQEFYFRDYETEEIPAQMENIPVGEDGTEHIFKENMFYYDRNKPKEDANGDINGYEKLAGKYPQREVRPAYEKPKYPNGRLVIRIDEEVKVTDRPWPYKRWPFAVAPSYLLPHLWYGVNCVELSRGFQDWMNIIGAHLTNYIKFFGDPQWMVEEGALAKDKDKKTGTIKNWAGSIVRVTKGALTSGRIKRDPPPPMPPTLFQAFTLFKDADQDLKGMHDVAQGKASGGDNTLGELQMLNRNTRQRIALQGALLDEWLKQIALLVVELMQVHYEVGDWVRWAGDEPEATKAAIEWTEEMASAVYDINLEPVSTLPYDEERELVRYKEAFSVTGPAMLEDYLKKLKIQNIPEILKRHEIIGPLMMMLELAQGLGMGPDEVMAAIQAQLQVLQSVAGPDGGSAPGAGSVPGPQPQPAAAGGPPEQPTGA